jgi:glycosyltransferase involved in cell wall biosynthesis
MRVMRVLTRPNLGGPTRQAIALWHEHRALGVTTLLVTGAVDAGEAMLSPAEHGVPRSSVDALRRPDAAGWLELPDLGRRLQPLADRRAARALREAMAAFRPDVVHTHTSKAGWLGRRAARAAGVPRLVHTFHGHVLQDYFAAPLNWLLRRLERRLAAVTHELVAVSGSCADELAAAGVAPRQRFRVVPPAVAPVPVLTRAEARRVLGIPPDQRRVAVVGRLVPVKRVADFVALVAAEPTVYGDVVGDGPLRAGLERAVSPAAAARVVFRGAEPRIASLLAAYDALVLPSVREGCPLVAVEAFAAGVPVVGYDVPGVRDALSVWGRGRLVPPAAGPAGLAAALRATWGDALGTAAAVQHNRRGIERFAPAAVAAELLAIYGPARD